MVRRTAGSRDAEFTEYAASRVGWLRKVAYLLCGDWDRADGLVQETITELYVKWPRTGRAENRDGYARTVLVKTFLAKQRTSWWRRTRRGGTAPAAATAWADVDATIDLRQALAALPPGQRAAVVLRHYCDLSIEQAADLLGCSAGNLRTRSSRGPDALGRSSDDRPAEGSRA
ncbi:sigma factor-like helix-turn-helix DNA-binding protein [Kitasatospora sp. NPDC093679]|uniref:sigma factor-like helix-turn-helix DNA-binding protein n=1 Tax=Kitasatospora sp. NPDC093679 TaxID=3154983 RepID=UPI0034272E9B